MKVVAGVLTYRVKRFGRVDELHATLASLREADELFLLDNASDDGSAELVRSLGGTVARNDDGNCTPGRGMNQLLGALAARDADIVAFSNDDMAWKPGWRAQLEAFWDAAPASLLILSGLLEPDYPWAQVLGRLDCGGVPALIRETAPGAAWTFRARDWPLIGPIPEKLGWDDVPTCHKIRAHGGQVAQADLAEHLGADKSTWGNVSFEWAKPLDRERWGLAE